MTSSITFADHTADTAPAGSRAALRATEHQFGFIPAAMARLAESPSVVAAFGSLSKLFEASTLDHREREVLVLTLAHDVGCEVCVAIHSAIVARTLADDPALLADLRAQRPLAEPRLEALRLFTRAVLATRGGVGDAELVAFVDAGFTRQQALDVVLGVATYTLTMFSNRLTRAPIDPPFASFAPARV